MIKLDDAFLRDVGLDTLPPDEKPLMLAHVYETVEMRVGMAIATSMTDRELDEFEAIIDEGDETEAATWLQTHCPRHSEIVKQHLEAVRIELRASAEQILAASTNGNHQPVSDRD